MGENTANPAPHGPLRRTLSSYALIPLVLMVGALAVGGAMAVQGLARVGQRLRPLESWLIVGAVILMVIGWVSSIDSVWGVLLVMGIGAGSWLAPDKEDWGRMRPHLPSPVAQRLIGAAMLVTIVMLSGQAVAKRESVTVAVACLGLTLAASQTLVRLEARKPAFRPISVKHTK